MKITPNQFAWAFVIVLLSLIGVAGYYVYKFIKNPADTVLSVENEQKLGEMIVKHQFNESNGFKQLHSPYADSCIQVIHTRLMEGVGTSKYQYTLALVTQEDPNAFAIPGGNIFIHSGLISYCNSPEELAAILAHEMGHVEKRHTVNGMVSQIGLTVLISAITSGDPGAIHEISGSLANNYFSREMESEADDFALQLLDKTKIDPHNLGEVFARMKHDHGDMEGALNLLSSHPELDQRAQKSAAYQVPNGWNAQPIQIDWSRFQNEVRSLNQAAGN